MPNEKNNSEGAPTSIEVDVNFPPSSQDDADPRPVELDESSAPPEMAPDHSAEPEGTDSPAEAETGSLSSSEDEADAEAMTPDDGEGLTSGEPEPTGQSFEEDESPVLLETVVDQSDELEDTTSPASSSENEADAEAMTPDDGEGLTSGEPEPTGQSFEEDESPVLLETVDDQSDEPESAALAASSSEDEADAEAMTPDDGEASTPNEPEFTRAGLAMDESSFPAAGEEPTPTIEPLVEVSLEETSALPAMSSDEIKANLEALLYAAGEPLTFRELKKVLRGVAPDLIKEGLGNLKDFYGAEGRGLQIVEVAGGFQITTRPEYHDRISRLFKVKPPARLSVQALETLAAIAYRQPITVPEILELRGVNSAGVVRTLLEKKLVRIMGRKPVVGRPILYGTSKEFLLRFGLKDLHELPRLEDMSEIFGDEVALPIDAAPDPSPSAAEVATDGVAEDDVPSPSAEDPEEFLAEKKGDGEIERG